MGKKGIRCKEIEEYTGARIQVPNVGDTSDIINVTGTRDSVQKAVQELQLISDGYVSKYFSD